MSGVKLVDQKVHKVRIEDVTVYEKNARKHSESQIKALARSIEVRGFRVPVRLSNEEEKVLVAGHGTLEACKLLNMTEILAVYDDDLTPEEIKAWRIAHNKLAELSEWDDGLLIEEFQDLLDLGFDLDLTGFGEEEIQSLKPSVDPKEMDEAEIEVNAYTRAKEKTRIKTGEVYELGLHRLMCGDARSKAHTGALIGSETARMTLTDPPYNVNMESIKHPKFKQRPIENDNQNEECWSEFCKAFIQSLKGYCSGDVYVCHAPLKDGQVLTKQLHKMGVHWSTTIIWVKQTFTLGRGKYQNRYEPMFYGWIGKSSYNNRRDLCNVWEIDRPMRSEAHPTMKPIELCARAINNSSKQGDIVLDLFGGSGSTLIACEQLDRKCYMMELDPVYCQIIIDRWEKFTGKKALKVIN